MPPLSHVKLTRLAHAIVTGTDMRQRPWGFAQTLRDVLVRSSGDPRLKCDPRTAELAVHADRFVACFNYVDMMAGVPLHDDQGTYDRPHRLIVYFDLCRPETYFGGQIAPRTTAIRHNPALGIMAIMPISA